MWCSSGSSELPTILHIPGNSWECDTLQNSFHDSHGHHHDLSRFQIFDSLAKMLVIKVFLIATGW